MEWLKQLGIKLKFRGATAAVATWIIAMAALGILGEGPIGALAFSLMEDPSGYSLKRVHAFS